jgi:hypothetical protein
MVHVMRDSRGVAFSWQKKVAVTDSPDKPVFLPTYSVSSGSLRWAAYNVQAWMARFAGMPYLFARYEDAVAHPATHLPRMVAHAGAETGLEALPVDGRIALTSPMHTVMGHPVRLERGSLRLRVDDEWRTAMAPRARRTVTAITLPLLVSCGYSVRTRGTPASSAVPLPANVSNGHSSNGHSSNGHSVNGYPSNGHSSNGYAATGHSSNGHASNGHPPTAEGTHAAAPEPPAARDGAARPASERG